MPQTVAVNSFVTRQVPGSGKSYVREITFADLACHAEELLNNHPERVVPGYRDGVVRVKVAPEWVKYFVCPIIKLEENTPLIAEVARRRENEEPYIRIKALAGEPLPTGSAELILYRHDVLAETDEAETDADWELIAFHAIPEGLEELPMHPVTMMRNQLALPGGTKGYYSSEEWAEAVRFWQMHAMLEKP